MFSNYNINLILDLFQVKPLLELVPDAKYPLELVEADLNNEGCWGSIVNGCIYVFQIASHPPPEGAVNENDLISQEVEGVLNVLKACSECESVKRVVMTSSIAAISSGMGGNPGRPIDSEYSENDWSIESSCPPFEKSKLMAERAAWDFVETLPKDTAFEFVVVNPSFIQGPLLSATSGAVSAALPKLLLERLMPAVPNVCLGIVDVRDVVAGEIAAMFTPSAAGKRFILNGGTTSFQEFAVIIRNEFESQGYNVPTSTIPTFILWVLKFFVPAIKAAYPGVNMKISWNNERMKNELGVTPRPINEAIIAMCYSLIELGVVTKTPGYHGPHQ